MRSVVRASRDHEERTRIPPRRGPRLDRTAEPDSRVDLSGQGLDPMCANRVASAMRFTERAAMVVRIVGEEAGDRIGIPLSPPRLESADPFLGAHRSLRHRS